MSNNVVLEFLLTLIICTKVLINYFNHIADTAKYELENPKALLDNVGLVIIVILRFKD